MNWIVSGERAFGEGVHGFEEIARRLPAIGERDVKLEIRLGVAHGEPPHGEPRAIGEREQRFGALQRLSAFIMDRQFFLPHLPFPSDARQSIATGPARGVERFELDRWGAAQDSADNQGVAAPAQAGERPPGQVARLEEDDHCHLCERGFALVYHELYDGRAQPAHGGALAERRQAALHPAHELASFAHVPDRAGGEPRDDRDCNDSDKLRHGGPDDSTPVSRGWRQALREFLYGLSGYEITQQALEIRAKMETLFMLGVFGDMLGVPILPPYYGLRLLPWVVPQVETWKRRVLRERELGSDHEHHLHGV
jgi:hypothetical protein